MVISGVDFSEKDRVLWQSGQACPRRCEQIVIIDTTHSVRWLRDKMWQDKDDTCLIVRDHAAATGASQRGPDDRLHQNAPRLFSASISIVDGLSKPVIAKPGHCQDTCTPLH